MKWFLSLIVLLLVAVPAKADIIYTATDFHPSTTPYGDQIIPMNLSSPGDVIKITGTAFGTLNSLDDGHLYVTNPIPGGAPYWMIYRGQYDFGGPHPFGILSWSDTEINLEVVHDFGQLLGNSITLSYRVNPPNGGEWKSIRGNLSLVPEPSSFLLTSLGVLAVFRRRR